MSNFISDCINGDALLSEIDDYVDQWHESNSEFEIHEYLGMSIKEYALYVEDDSYLAIIVTAKREKTNIDEIINTHLSMAARSNDQSKSERLERWLKDEGLLEK